MKAAIVVQRTALVVVFDAAVVRASRLRVTAMAAGASAWSEDGKSGRLWLASPAPRLSSSVGSKEASCHG